MKKKTAENSTKRFLAVSATLLLGWLLCYEGYLKHLGQPDAFLTLLTARAGSEVLSGLGFSTIVGTYQDGVRLYLETRPLLKVADNCNGLAVFALFTGFIAAFPGGGKNKWWFIPAGLLILFSANIVRVVSLCLIQMRYPQWLDFNHKYSFTIIIYALVFALWMWWVNKFSKPASKIVIPA